MGRRFSFPLFTVLTAFTLYAGAAHAQDTAPRLNVNAAEIAISGRVQAQLNTSDADAVREAEMILRRVRLGATVRVNDLVSGRVHVDFAGNDVSIADAYMQLDLHPAAQLMAGRAYRPFGIMEQTSSLQIIPIERGLSIRGIQDFDLSAILNGLRYSDRDIGIQLRGSIPDTPLGIGYALGVFAGPTTGDTGGEQTQQYVARVMINPVARTRVGVAWSRRDFVREPDEGVFDTEPGNAFVLDVEYGGPTPAAGAHIMAELAKGDFDPFSNEDFTGGQVWAGYLFPVGDRISLVEPLLRVSHASIDRLDVAAPDGGVLVTPGVNFYLGGLNRLMLNYDIWRAATGVDGASGKVQFQLTF